MNMRLPPPWPQDKRWRMAYSRSLSCTAAGQQPRSTHICRWETKWCHTDAGYRPQTWDPSLSRWLCFSWPILRGHHSRDSVTQASSTLVKDVGYLDSVTTPNCVDSHLYGMKTMAQDGWSILCLHPHTSVSTAVKNCRVYLVLLKIFKHLVRVDDSIIHVYTVSKYMKR